MPARGGSTFFVDLALIPGAGGRSRGAAASVKELPHFGQGTLSPSAPSGTLTFVVQNVHSAINDMPPSWPEEGMLHHHRPLFAAWGILIVFGVRYNKKNISAGFLLLLPDRRQLAT
jgi:hypothetical protein